MTSTAKRLQCTFPLRQHYKKTKGVACDGSGTAHPAELLDVQIHVACPTSVRRRKEGWSGFGKKKPQKDTRDHIKP